MKQILTRLGIAAGILAAMAAVLFGAPGATQRAQANPLEIEVFNPGICLALTAGNPAGPAAGCLSGTSLAFFSNNANLMDAANKLGDNDGVIEASDFAGVATFSGAQIHQQDDALSGGSNISELAVVAFVDSDAPVTFHTNAGQIWTGPNQGATYVCDATFPATDSDCGNGFQGTEDHAVVVYIRCDATTCPTLGPAELTVEQNGIVEPVPFTIVGEPRSVEFFTLESGIQAGNFAAAPLSNRTANSTFNGNPAPCSEVPLRAGDAPCSPVSKVCPFSASLPFITHALGLAEETVVVARALDINGTQVIGAWFNWTVDNNGVPTPGLFASDNITVGPGNTVAAFSPVLPTNFDGQGILSQPTTPTLDLGAFGFGAPNILCAPSTAKAGSVTVRATLTRVAQGGQAAVDPRADPSGTECPTDKTDPNSAHCPGPGLVFGEKTFTVSAAPANLALTADPATIPCDGTATSTVSATITDAAGNPAISGTAVNFSSIINATANPINATTNDKGVATSVISPLAGTTTGVPVTVTVSIGGVAQPNLTQQILVQCTGAAAAPTPGGTTPGGTPPGGAPGGTGSGPTGITGPNTGNGGFGSAGVGTLSWWPMLALVAGAAALGGARLAVKRIR